MAKEDEIRLIAYNIWEEEGCCDGQDVDHWLRAEVIWEERKADKTAAKAPKARAAKPATKAKPARKKS